MAKRSPQPPYPRSTYRNNTMIFSQNTADLFIPDSAALPFAAERTTHLGVGAHQDDLEFMALHGILECFLNPDQWFGGVTCTDGAGSARTGPYASYTDDDMKAVRASEQRKAAAIGQYSLMAQLGHPSKTAKDSAKRDLMVDDLGSILQASQPQIVYTHNPFDKHATHVGVFFALLEAIRRLPKEHRPKQLIGCEVWRSLDWLPDQMKVIQNLDAHPNLAAALNGVFDSQITGGKRYDLAVEGRRRANATFFDSHSTDDVSRIAYAVDLTPLIQNDSLEVDAFVADMLAAFSSEVSELTSSLG